MSLFCVVLFLLLSPPQIEAQEKYLPIRGERLLSQLSRPLPSIEEVSVSPDGNKILYLEIHEANTQNLWLVNLENGRRFILSAESDSQTVISPPRPFRPKWSHDSRRVGLLDTRDSSTLSLIVWDTDKKSAPARIPLKHFNKDLMTGRSIFNWVWLSDRNEVIFALQKRLTLPPPIDQDLAAANKIQGSTWIKSWFDEARDEAIRRENSNRLTPLRIFKVALDTQTTQELVTGVDIYPTRGTWHLTRNRLEIFISTQDPRMNQLGEHIESYQMMLINQNDPKSAEFRKARSRVYALDIQSGRARQIYSGGPGRISSVLPLADSDEIAMIEGDASLTVWPSGGNFGRLRQLIISKNRSHSVRAGPVVLPSEIYASNRPNHIYLYETSVPESRLYEVALSTGESVLITPSELSAKSVDVSETGDTVAAVLENVNTVPELYVWKTNRREWQKLTDYAATDVHGLGAIKKLTWRSLDNRFDIDGFLVTPSNFDPNKKYPLLVWIHGGPTVSQLNSFNRMIGLGGVPAHVFAAEGYLVLLPNFRGDRRYSVEFSRAVHGNMDKTYKYDIDAGVNYLINKGWADPNRLGIMGFSGGSLQVSHAIAHTNRYKAAVSIDGPWLQPGIHVLEFGTNTQGPHPGVAVSPEGMRVFLGFDPVERTWVPLSQIRTPLLLRWSRLAGPLPEAVRNDVYGMPVGPEFRLSALLQSKLLSHILKKNNVPFEVIIDTDEHGLRNPKYVLEFQSRLLHWFDYFMLGKGEYPIPASKYSIAPT